MTGPRTAHSAAEMIARQFQEAQWHLCYTPWDWKPEWRNLDDGSKRLLIDTFRELLGPDGCLDVRFPGVDRDDVRRRAAALADEFIRDAAAYRDVGPANNLDPESCALIAEDAAERLRRAIGAVCDGCGEPLPNCAEGDDR